MAVAKVIIDVALDQEFDYRIPESLAGMLKVGMMVTVPPYLIADLDAHITVTYLLHSQKAPVISIIANIRVILSL